jgi:hypothetical protein
LSLQLALAKFRTGSAVDSIKELEFALIDAQQNKFSDLTVIALINLATIHSRILKHTDAIRYGKDCVEESLKERKRNSNEVGLNSRQLLLIQFSYRG